MLRQQFSAETEAVRAEFEKRLAASTAEKEGIVAELSELRAAMQESEEAMGKLLADGAQPSVPPVPSSAGG